MKLLSADQSLLDPHLLEEEPEICSHGCYRPLHYCMSHTVKLAAPAMTLLAPGQMLSQPTVHTKPSSALKSAATHMLGLAQLLSLLQLLRLTLPQIKIR